MKRFLLGYAGAGVLVFLVAGPSRAQMSGSQGAPDQPGEPSQTPIREAQPVYIDGRVLLEDGKPVPERVPLSLFCGLRQVQAVYTDLKGYFHFSLGAGPQGNFDTSAANDDTFDSTGFSGGLGTAVGSSGNPEGCDLQISLSGYQPLSKFITGSSDVGSIDAGTLLLRRIDGVQGSAISVTSMQVPAAARKEYDQGEKEIQNKHMGPAAQHLEKAVALDDKFAAAWNELGRVYGNGRQMDKAQQAFGKAIEADPKYILPYIGLAGLQLQQQHYQNAVDTAGKALALDPGVTLAMYDQALGYFQLNRVDDAEKSATAVESGLHPNIPYLRVLLAQIYIVKADYPKALDEMRAYLKESPQGPFAGEVKQNLDSLEKYMSGPDAGAPNAAAPSQPTSGAPQ